jgi:magnesium transporter
MVRYYAKKGGKLLELEQPEHGCWVNITPPYNTEELEEAAQYFEVPLDFITDSLDVDVITVSSNRDNPVLQRFLEDKIKNFDPADETLFILQILEHNVYRFLTYLKKLDLKRNLIEQELYHSSKNRELKQLLSIEKSLVYFVNSLNANDLLKLKIKRTDFLSIRDDEEKTDLFEDIIIDNGQALDMANVYSNILSGTMDTYASIISNNMNVTIHRLTLVTIFIAVPTLITSFFGMNVPLPFSGSRFAILFIFVFSSVISLLIAWYFQRKRLF